MRVLVSDECNIQFEINDTGIGMSEGELNNIFTPFTQADQNIQKQFGGTGLGLVISRHYARMMGGDIVVKSEVGIGFTFTFSIPMEDDVSNSDIPDRMVG